MFGGLTVAQADALCNVAFGGRGGGVHPRTLKTLADRDLIVPVEMRDGNFRWTEWEMPISVHIDFCAWCDQREEIEA